MARGLSDLQKAILVIAKQNVEAYSIQPITDIHWQWGAHLAKHNLQQFITGEPKYSYQRYAESCIIPVHYHEIFHVYFGHEYRKGRSFYYENDRMEWIIKEQPRLLRGYWLNERQAFKPGPKQAERVSASRAVKRLQERGLLISCYGGAHVTQKFVNEYVGNVGGVTFNESQTTK